MEDRGYTLLQLIITLAIIAVVLIPVYFGGVYLFVKIVKLAWGE